MNKNSMLLLMGWCVGALMIILHGCAKNTPGLFTTVVYTQGDLNLKSIIPNGPSNVPVLWQAQFYAQVNSAGLASFGSRFRERLFAKGIPISEVTGSSGWNPKFNCVLFAESYVADMGAELFAAQFQTFTTVQRPAVFIIFYRPNWSPILPDGTHEYHAIVQVITEAGSKFIEPQDTRGSGEVILAPEELASIIHRRA